MHGSGPISFIAGALEWLAGIGFLVAPFVLDFDSARATWISVGIGVTVLVVAVGRRLLRPAEGGDGLSAFARGTSVDIEAGEHTVLDD